MRRRVQAIYRQGTNDSPRDAKDGYEPQIPYDQQTSHLIRMHHHGKLAASRYNSEQGRQSLSGHAPAARPHLYR